MNKNNLQYLGEEEKIFNSDEINGNFIDIDSNFLVQTQFDFFLPLSLDEEENYFPFAMKNNEDFPNFFKENNGNNSSISIIDYEISKINPNDINSTFNISKNNDNTNPKITKNINFKTVLHHKRGRKEKYENPGKKSHGSGDFDNIQRKIQVCFINFLINLANDAIKTVYGEDTKFCFKDVKYKYKKIVSHNYVEKLKQCKFSDIIKLDISPKNRSLEENSNIKTFMEICGLSHELERLFNKNYLYLFQKYFCEIKSNQDTIDCDGFKIKLSQNTKGLFNLLNKNSDVKEKFIEVVENVYFSGINFKNEEKYGISNLFVISNKK